MPELGKATYIVEIDTKRLDKGLKKARVDIERATDEAVANLKDVEKTSGKTSDSVVKDQQKMDKSVESLGDSFGKLNGTVEESSKEIDSHDKSIKTATKDHDHLKKNILATAGAMVILSKAFKLMKWPAILTAGGTAVRGLSVLTGGAVELTAALAPLSGAMASAGNAYLAMGEAFAVFKIADFKNLSAAMGGSEAALKKLTPAARSFMEQLKSLKPQWDALKKSVQGPLFAGLNKGLQAAKGNFGILKTALSGMSGVLGRLAVKAGELLGSKGFGSAFGKVAKENNLIVSHLGDTFLHLADAFIHVLVAARPLTTWLVKMIDTWAKSTDATAKSAKGQQRLATFFQHTKDSIQVVFNVLSPLFRALKNIFSLARGPGMTLWSELAQSAKNFADWTDSASGKNTIKQYFIDIMPALREMGRLVHDITIAFFNIGHNQDLAPIIKTIRTEFLPMVTTLLDDTAKRLGPEVINLLINLGKTWINLAGASTPLILFMEALNFLLGGINTLLSNQLIRTFAVWTIVIIGTVSIITHLVSLLKGLKELAVVQVIGSWMDAWGASTAIIQGNTAAIEENRAARALAFARGSKTVPAEGPVTKEGKAPVATVPLTTGENLARIAPVAAGVAAALALVAASVLAIKDNFLGLRDILGAVVQPFVNVFVDFGEQIDKISGGKLGDLFQTIGHAIGSILGPIQDMAMWVFKLLGFLTVMGSALAVFTILSPILVPVIAALKVITIILRALNPIFNAFKVVVAAAFGVLKTMFTNLTGTMTTLINALRGPFTAVWNAIKTTITNAVNQIKSSLTVVAAIIFGPFLIALGGLITIWPKITMAVQFAWGIIRGIFNALRSVASSVFGAVKTIIENGIVHPIQEVITRWTGGRGILVGVWNTIKSAAATIFAAIKNVIMPPIQAVIAFLKDRFQNVKSVLITIWGAIKSGISKEIAGIKAIFDTVKQAIQFVVDKFNQAKSQIINAVNTFKQPVVDAFHAIKDIADAIVRTVQKVIQAFKDAADAPKDLFEKGKNFITSGGGLFNQEGGVIKAQTGGALVPGHGSGDRVPAMLEPGEVVWNREAVKKLGGPETANSVNAAIPRFQGGGLIGNSMSMASYGGGLMGLDAIAFIALLAAVAGAGAGNVQAMFKEAMRMDALHKPYQWGGGHAGFSQNGPWDCSGAVSQVIHGAGLPLSSPMVSGGFMNYGAPGLTSDGKTGIWANSGHVWMTINGQGFSTSGENPGDGWGTVSYTSRSGFVKRHPVMGDSSSGPNNSKGQPLDQKAQRGGIIQGFQGGGIIAPMKHGKQWIKQGRSGTYNTNETATLAWQVGAVESVAKNLSRVTMPESSGISNNVGNDPGGTKGYGLWQITTGWHDDLINKYGGPSGVMVPPNNAAAALSIYSGEHMNAWNASRSGWTAPGNILKAAVSNGPVNAGGKGTKGAPKKKKKTAPAAYFLGWPGWLPGFESQAASLGALADEADYWSQNANAVGGPVFGKTEKDWLLAELGPLMQLRNFYIETYVAMQVAIDQINGLIAWVNEQLQRIKEQIAELRKGWSGLNRDQREERQKKIDALIRRRDILMYGTDKHRAQAAAAAEGTGAFPPIDNWAGKNNLILTRDTYGGYVAPSDSEDALMGKMDALQGAYGPWRFSQGDPPMGEVGGRILEVQTRIKQLDPASDVAGMSQAAEQLGIEAQQRLLTSQLQYPVFRDFFAAGAAAGLPTFHTGGIISGRRGVEQPIVGLPGEGVFTEDQMESMGGVGSVEVGIHGDLITDREFEDAIEVKVNGVLADNVKKARLRT